MATLIDYKGLQVLDAATGPGGEAINDDFKVVADRLATSRYIDALRLAYVSANSVSVGVGGAISGDGSLDIAVSSPLTLDITTSGVNGLDAGSEAANTWYAVHVIGDSTGTNPPAGLFSLSATAPTLPSGYDKFRRVGWVRNNATSDFLKFNQRWSGHSRRYWYDENAAGVLLVLVGGTATVFTPVSLATVVPPTAENVVILGAFIAAAATDFWLVRRTGDTSPLTFFSQPGVTTAPALAATQMELPCNASQSIDYLVSTVTSSLFLAVQGFDDEV